MEIQACMLVRLEEVARLRLGPRLLQSVLEACGCLVTRRGLGTCRGRAALVNRRTSQVNTRKFNQGGEDKSAVSNCLGWQEREGQAANPWVSGCLTTCLSGGPPRTPGSQAEWLLGYRGGRDMEITWRYRERNVKERKRDRGQAEQRNRQRERQRHTERDLERKTDT